MRHGQRKRERANAARRAEAERRQAPLSDAEQKLRAGERAEAHRRKYPVPPVYRPAHNAKKPAQPVCYWTARELVLGHEE